MNRDNRLEELFRLEDMLRHVYSGRADVGMIDELIQWLEARRAAMIFVQTGILPDKKASKQETA